MTLNEAIAHRAGHIVHTLTHTDYQHDARIDEDTGVYDCDCNGFPIAFLFSPTLDGVYADRKIAIGRVEAVE